MGVVVFVVVSVDVFCVCQVCTAKDFLSSV